MRSLVLLVLVSCAGSRFQLEAPPKEPFDVVLVPGCPNEADGSLSRCQLGRAGLAALVWKRGWTRYFVTSGGAVHTPYEEAYAIAQAMVVLGVPGERIFLDPDALHTDENMYNGLRIAQAMGFTKIAVASNAGQAGWGCEMLESYGLDRCTAIPMVISDLEAFMPPFEPALFALRTPKDPAFVSIDERERERALKSGRARPSSIFLYPALGYLRWIGKPWRPMAPEKPTLRTFAKRP